MAKGHTIIGLDVGTSRVKTIVVRQPSGEELLEVLDTEIFPSFGLRKGVVINIDDVSKSIIESVNLAKENSRQKIGAVYASLGGSHIFSTPSHGVVAVSRADQKISQEDIDRVLQAAQAISLPSNKQILHTLPIQFTIDSEGGIKNALGLSGVRLEVEALLLGGFSPYIKNLTQAILDSDLEINDLVISPLAAARACLTPRQKELGVALLDIGAGTTSLAIFEEGDLIHLAIFPIGSAHITNDIAIGLRCDIDIAERIKQEYGIASPQWVSKKDVVDISSTLGSTLVFSRKRLAEIIEARLTDIFDLVKKEFKKMTKEILLPAGIVLTGGGANLPKIVDLAKKELRLPCHLGIPMGFQKPIEDPSLSVVCGLALWGLDLEGESKGPSSDKKISSRFKKMFKVFIP